jgi:hypothetical protein
VEGREVNLRDLDQATLDAEQIRRLQSRYPSEHAALLNWGAWSRDRSGIFPKEARTKVFEQFVPDGTEAFGEIDDEFARTANTDPALLKAERDETEPYDEKSGTALDSRINGPMLSLSLKRVLTTAYVNGGASEHRWYVYADCVSLDSFCERLEAGLQFVRRFV